jgi:hypothetical protein
MTAMSVGPHVEVVVADAEDVLDIYRRYEGGIRTLANVSVVSPYIEMEATAETADFRFRCKVRGIESTSELVRISRVSVERGGEPLSVGEDPLQRDCVIGVRIASRLAIREGDDLWFTTSSHRTGPWKVSGLLKTGDVWTDNKVYVGFDASLPTPTAQSSRGIAIWLDDFGAVSATARSLGHVLFRTSDDDWLVLDRLSRRTEAISIQELAMKCAMSMDRIRSVVLVLSQKGLVSLAEDRVRYSTPLRVVTWPQKYAGILATLEERYGKQIDSLRSLYRSILQTGREDEGCRSQ